MNQAATDVQKAIVAALVHGISGEWERIVVNYEMQEEDGGLTEDRLGFYRRGGAGRTRRGRRVPDLDPP